MKVLIHNLVRLRKERGISQETLAERSGLATAHISQIETGRRWPKPSTIEALAVGLKVSPSELFVDDSIPARQPTPQQALKIITEIVESVNLK